MFFNEKKKFYDIPVFKEKAYCELNELIENEINLFNTKLNLIGSGSYTFKNVLKALGSPLALNPAEGFPTKRYFPACDNLDQIELIGNNLALDFFDASKDDYCVSLQPHSGTQSNHIVFNSLFLNDKKQTIISMSSNSGGHVSHNYYPSKFFKLVNYSVESDGTIDYDKIDILCAQYNPVLLIGGASSYPREIDYQKLGAICKKHNTLLLADISHTAVLVASKQHQSPFGYADFISMTTNKGTRGPRGGIIFYRNKYQKSIERSIFPLSQGSPKYNEILAKVVMFMELKRIDFKEYAAKITKLAVIMSDYFIARGCKVYSDGTTSHLVVLDLSKTTLTGKQAETKLLSIGILANRNMIPNDKRSPLETSGIRFGTVCPACIDMTNDDFVRICECIYNTLFTSNKVDKELVARTMANYYLKD